MTIDAALRRQVAEVEQVVLERHAKYGPTNVSAAPGGPLNGLRVRLHDKLARLNNFVDGGADADFDDDSLRDCFTDVVGYGLIGLLVLAGDWPGSGEAPVRDGRVTVLPPDPERVGALRVGPTGVEYVRHSDGWHYAGPAAPLGPTLRGRNIRELDANPNVTDPTVEMPVLQRRRRLFPGGAP